MAKWPSSSTEALSKIEEHEPGALLDVALPGSKSLLLDEPSEGKRTVIDIPSSENGAWIAVTGTEM